MPDNTTAARAVFLSYAREDAEAVRRIADALRAFGVEVWFDQNELRGGDAWDAKIRTQIRTCTLCVPVISAATQSRGEGYFRREWKIAVERTHDMAAGVPFLLPVVIDGTAESEALVPEEFMRVQWTRLDRGVPTPQFVEQVRKLLEKPGKQTADPGHSRPPVFGKLMAPPKKSGIPAWSWGLIVAVVVGITTAVVVSNKSSKPAAPVDAPAKAVAESKPVAPVAPKLSDKSIAVLPFTNMSEDKDSGFFADGVHEDVLTNLALIRELRVVSRTSVMSYRATTKPMRQIAQELGVTYILEGSVRRSGNKVRVTGQLIHAATDEHVWAQSYDRDLTDVFTIQAELSQQIAGALKAALSPEEKVFISRKPTNNPAAYDLYLRARDVTNREGNNIATTHKRAQLLESAVQLDPAFAQAWAELADAYAYSGFIMEPGMDALLAKAKAAIERAVQLAPDDTDVIRCLGTYYYYGYRDYARATEQYERLAKRQPNDPTIFHALGLIQRRQGQWAQSLASLRRACELDPASLRYLFTLKANLIAGRRYAELEVTQRRIVALLPDRQIEAVSLAGIPYVARGSTKEAEEFIARLTPEQVNSRAGIRIRQNWARTRGDWAEAIRLDKLQPYLDDYGQPHSEQALLAARDLYAQGDRPAAIARLGEFPAEIRAQLEKEPGNARAWSVLGDMEAILGHPAEAERCLDRSVALLPVSLDAVDGVLNAIFRSLTLDLLGEKERALAEYTRLIRQPSPSGILNVHLLKTGFSTLHGDPRFEALLNDPKNNEPLF